jgi:tetratricopeptide (TPR) repeat protein
MRGTITVLTEAGQSQMGVRPLSMSGATTTTWHAWAMAVIDAAQRTRECDALIDAAVAARHDDEARVEALRACVSHPCAYHELDLPELYRELGETLSRLKRYGESLDAWEAAIAAGDRGLPHPRTNVAEVLLRAGRREEADVVFADLRRQCPDDIWLYNAAGFAFAWMGEHAAALPWLEEGIAMALADGDREGILHQLDEERTRCREALGLTDDQLTARVAAFERPDWPPGAHLDHPKTEMLGEAHPDRSPCAHCGWEPKDAPPTEMHLDELEWLAEHVGRRPAPVVHERQAPVRAAKVGRNEPCPCGSGRKHKHCCGR